MTLDEMGTDSLAQSTCVATLRVTAALGRQDLFNNVFDNLMDCPMSFQKKVIEEVREKGGITLEEIRNDYLISHIILDIASKY